MPVTGSTLNYDEILRIEEARRAEIQDLYDNAPCGYHSVAADGRIVRMNATELRWLGFRRDEVEGKLFIRDIFTPESLPAVESGLAELRAYPDRHLEREVTMRRKDGSTFEALVAVSALTDRNGRFLMTRASVFDITERKRAEDALRKSEASLANAQRIAHMGDWAWNVETGELRWSDEIYRIFGTEKTEFGATYQAFLSFVHPEDRPLVEQAVDRALYQHAPYDIEHRIVLPDGRIRIVHEQGEVEYGPEGRPRLMCGVVQDVTEFREAVAASERRAAELAKVREMEDLRSAFIGSMSHDLRQPITTITGYCEVMLDELHGPLTESQKRDLTLILRAAERLKIMVDDLLDSARIQAGTFKAVLRPANLAPIAEEIISHFGPMADQKRIRLRSLVDDSLPLALLDRGQMERVISNLVHNALKYTPEEGEVCVALLEDDGEILLEVRDSGPGIAAEDIPRLFQRFSQVGGGLVDGVGLGLSICKAIVEAHHGRIGVESEVGRGTTFWVRLPIPNPSRES